jgi:uracil-DNA glycosylase
MEIPEKGQMSSEYLALADERVNYSLPGYGQPEDYGYNFKEWVSPYTKGAHQLGGIAIVLQDWSSHDGLEHKVDQSVQEYGRTISLKTNLRLEELLKRVFSVGIKDVYATNVFPFIKPDGISTHIPLRLIKQVASKFVAKELELAKPKIILALGNAAHYGLKKSGIECIHVPHPAARIGSIDQHEKRWIKSLKQKGII